MAERVTTLGLPEGFEVPNNAKKTKQTKEDIAELVKSTGFVSRPIQRRKEMQQLNVKIEEEAFDKFLEIVRILDTSKKRAMERMIADYLSRLT